MAIRWRKSDIKELRTYVQRFNAKITRVSKRNPELAEFLPQRLSVRELQESITERKDFNNMKKSVDRFMKKGSERLTTLGNGVVTTAWQKKEYEIQRDVINRRRAAARKKAGETPSGRMGKVESWANRPLPEIGDVKGVEWERFVKRLEEQSKQAYVTRRDETYLANWVQAVYNEFGDEWGDQILAATAKLDRAKLIDAIIDRDDLSVSFVYSLVELEARKDRLIAELERL